MATLKDIRRRITSVEKTQKITRAMRMVAGAKLRRAQEAIEAGRPYADQMRRVLAEVSRSQGAEHPLLETREERSKLAVVAVTSNRGLCGAFNLNVGKAADAAIAERKGSSVTILSAGRKGREYFKHRRPDQLGEDFTQDGWVTYGQAVAIAGAVTKLFLEREVDEVVLVYSEFVSTMTQTPRAVTLLPFSAAELDEGGALTEATPFEIEPNAAAVLATLVPRAVEVELYRALLENQAGEHAARMTAMESATRNTQELIQSLKLQFNRARQAAITKELVEIVSGADAL